MKKRVESIRPNQGEDARHQVRLPKFISDEEIGLGDVMKQTTAYFGIRTCEACGRRADVLNRWLVFTNRHTNYTKP